MYARAPATPHASGAARTRHGTVIAYTLLGDPAARSKAALLHSLALDRHVWLPVGEILAAEGAVLLMDCRGHGASGDGPRPYTAAGMAEDLADLLDALGWRAPLVAGASMGGCVALAFAQAFPDRLSALGLVDTTAWYGPTAATDWAERAARGAAPGGLDGMAAFQATRWFGDGFRAANPVFLEDCLAAFRRTAPESYAEACRMLGACDLRAGLGRVRVPTAVVVGEEDYATPPAMAAALRDGIAGASLAVLPGARHLTTLEAPQAVAAELRRIWSAAA